MRIAYEQGLHELGDGLFAYLQPDGGWGWSNAGLIAGAESSLLVDTLYDLRLTRQMLAAMDPVLQACPIQAAVNTHGDPDHCFGNELLPSGAELYATVATAAEIAELSPQLLAQIKSAPGMPPEITAFADVMFGPFEFDGITVRGPSQTFTGQLDVRVGDREVTFLELGPAHTEGDTIVHLPDAGVVFTGDLLFSEGTPMVWSNLSNWIAACDRIVSLGAAVLVPGHGPVTDASGVRDLQRYLSYVRAEAQTRFEAGMTPAQAADDIDITDYADWGDPERIAANVVAAYRELDPSLAAPSRVELVLEMARWHAAH